MAPWLIEYMLTSFIIWDFNPGHWTEVARGTTGVLSLISSLSVIAIAAAFNTSERISKNKKNNYEPDKNSK